MDVLKEEWEVNPKASESVLSHVMVVRERLEKMTDLVQQNMRKAQSQQKRWYDHNARECTLKSGDHVLVLLPTSTLKLLAQWQRPYEVLKQVGRVNYLVDMADRKKRRRVFHINMLRQWQKPASMNYFAEEEWIDEEEMDATAWDSGAEGEPTVGEALSQEQRLELKELLRTHSSTLTNKPGFTTLLEHCIEIRDSHPIRLPPYRLPHAYREEVRRKLKEMQAQGIIEPSNS